MATCAAICSKKSISSPMKAPCSLLARFRVPRLPFCVINGMQQSDWIPWLEHLANKAGLHGQEILAAKGFGLSFYQGLTSGGSLISGGTCLSPFPRSPCIKGESSGYSDSA